MKELEDILTYLKPDSIWEVFGAKNQNVFIEKYITKGKFHKNVPKKIIDDYKIVESLQFYSYYNYSLIDEAFAKSTRIFESSIDIKINELGIEKEGFESLNSKIKRLEKYSSMELIKQWDKAREIRNIFAHQKAGTLMGIILIKAFKHNINMINSVFLEKHEIERKENSLKKLSEESLHLKKGLFILEYNEKKYLIWSIIPYSTNLEFNDKLESFWVLHPVYGTKKIENISQFPDPFILNLKNIKISENDMVANIVNGEKKINVARTDNIENIEKLKRHQLQMIDIDSELKREYWVLLESEINKKMTEFIYQSWDKHYS